MIEKTVWEHRMECVRCKAENECLCSVRLPICSDGYEYGHDNFWICNHCIASILVPGIRDTEAYQSKLEAAREWVAANPAKAGD